MGTATETFHFAGDEQGWTANPGHAHVHMSWRFPHRSRRVSKTRDNVMGGCLRTTFKNTTATTNNYWELSTTWEALGVPAGQTVVSVSIDYQYRWDFSQSFGSTVSTTTNTSGPMELRDSTGTLIGTSSAGQVLATTDRGGHSGGERGTHWPYGPGTTGLLTDSSNHNWATVTGSPVAVTDAASASNATVHLRLNSQLQALNTTDDYMRLRQDRVVVTVTYGAAAVTQRIYIV